MVAHAGNKLAMQEFMILPVGAESSGCHETWAEVYHTLKGVIKDKYGKDATNVGDEGGFAPNILENSEALELVKEAIDKAGYTEKIVIGMDVAASEFIVMANMTWTSSLLLILPDTSLGPAGGPLPGLCQGLSCGLH